MVHWLLQLADEDRNFPRNMDAVAWLRTRSSDARIRPVVIRHSRGAYTFYGPKERDGVLRATIDRLSFALIQLRHTA